MTTTTSPTSATPDTRARRDLRAEVRRMHAGVLVFYAVDALLLGLFGAGGTVSPQLWFWYGLAGCTSTQVVYWWFQRRGGRADDLETLGLATTAAAGLVMLATLASAPPVGGLMLMSMMAVLALSAVQLSRRHQLGLCVLLATGSVAILAATGASPGVPAGRATESVLSAVWLAWLMAKASAHNLTGTRLRERVRAANAALAQALQAQQTIAATDELTRLPNRRAILAHLRQAMAGVPQPGTLVGLALLDIDHFKRINDTHGHEIGDQVLCEFGHLVLQRLRPTDQLGRYGGEEFLLVLQQLDGASAAAEVVDRLRTAIAAHDWSRLAAGLAVTASAGVVLLVPGEDSAAAIHRADGALYQAKGQGRNRVVAAETPAVAQASPQPPAAQA